MLTSDTNELFPGPLDTPLLPWKPVNGPENWTGSIRRFEGRVERQSRVTVHQQAWTSE